TTIIPSGVIATDLTSSSWPSNNVFSVGCSESGRSHTHNVLSLDAETARSPLLLMATPRTAAVCLRRTATPRDSTGHTQTVPSAEPEMTRLPSGVIATHKTADFLAFGISTDVPSSRSQILTLPRSEPTTPLRPSGVTATHSVLPLLAPYDLRLKNWCLVDQTARPMSSEDATARLAVGA